MEGQKHVHSRERQSVKSEKFSGLFIYSIIVRKKKQKNLAQNNI